MQILSRSWLSLVLAALFLQACSEKSTQAPSTTTAAAASAPEEPQVAKKEIQQTDGMYELANVLAWAMPTLDTTAPQSLPPLQNYNRFKGVVSEIKAGRDVRYEGRTNISVDGKRAVVENIEDDYRWKVSIDGPEAGAALIEIDSVRAVSTQSGPAYLRKMGFELINLVCFSEGDTPTNAAAIYLAKYPGKQPTLLRFSVSTGSGGLFLAYSLHFGQVDWRNVPGATEKNFEGLVEPFGFCKYKELI